VEKKVIDLLCDKPDLYLDEIQWFLFFECDVQVGLSTISRHLRMAKWTKKKLEKRASQRVELLRTDWRRKVSIISAEMCVFCDESGTDRRDGSRRTGWSPIGQAPWAYAPFRRGNRCHLLPAIATDGIVDVLLYEGQSNAEGFELWLETRLLPKMNAFPAPKSVLVMDNAGWHRNERIQALCDRFGVLLWYLPPHSPDFNPIEAYFSDLKAYIRRWYRYKGGDQMGFEDFKVFLIQTTLEVGKRTEQIRGHFRNSGVPFRFKEGEEVDYCEVFAEEFQEFMTTGTVR
jgi:transposase